LPANQTAVRQAEKHQQPQTHRHALAFYHLRIGLQLHGARKKQVQPKSKSQKTNEVKKEAQHLRLLP
jgi:hypothetical protein